MRETHEMTKPVAGKSPPPQRALKILAKSVYRELKSSGYSRSEVVAFTTELLDLVTGEMRQDSGTTG